MNEKTEELIDLVKENPNLPIIPMVYGNICEGDYTYYLGSFGNCHVDKYVIKNDRVWFWDEREELVEDIPTTFSDDEALEIVEEYDWIEAIIIFIEECK